MNFHLANNVFFRRDGDDLLIVKAKEFDDPGEVLVRTDINGFASIVASFSPCQEQYGSYGYILEFLQNGTMFCGGCGCRMKPGESGGTLSVLNVAACMKCYEQKFKPLFEWAMETRKCGASLQS